MKPTIEWVDLKDLSRNKEKKITVEHALKEDKLTTFVYVTVEGRNQTLFMF